MLCEDGEEGSSLAKVTAKETSSTRSGAVAVGAHGRPTAARNARSAPVGGEPPS